MGMIITTSDAGAGHLKQRFAGVHTVKAYMPRLVRNAIPQTRDLQKFFRLRSILHDKDQTSRGAWIEDFCDGPSIAGLPDASVLASDAEGIQLWIDPDLNAGLVLLQLLDQFSELEIPAVQVFSSSAPLGAVDAAGPPAPVKPWTAGPSHFRMAGTAWAALSEATPAAFADLPAHDLDIIPGLDALVHGMLAELPDTTGLAASERRILARLEREMSFISLAHEMFQGREADRTLNSFEFGKILDQFAGGAEPLVDGLSGGPFDLALHDDHDRLTCYLQSRLRLTKRGRAVIAGEADWLETHDIGRWWGGVRLSRSACWRWDAATSTLRAPQAS